MFRLAAHWITNHHPPKHGIFSFDCSTGVWWSGLRSPTSPRNSITTPIFNLAIWWWPCSLRGAYEKPGEIEQILASHSRIYGAGELTWINKLVLPLLTKYAVARNNGENLLFSQTDIRPIRETYSIQLSKLTIGEEIVTDKMPLNFMWIGIILSAFPDAKIVNLRRDPIATCWSNFKCNFKTGNGCSFNLDDRVEYHPMYEELMVFWKARYTDKIYAISYEQLTEHQAQERYTGSSDFWRKYEAFFGPIDGRVWRQLISGWWPDESCAHWSLSQWDLRIKNGRRWPIISWRYFTA